MQTTVYPPFPSGGLAWRNSAIRFRSIGSAAGYSGDMYDYEITAQDAAILVEEKTAKIIDVREPWEYSTAHIDGTTLIPMGEFAARAHQELDPEDRLLILCHHGARSLSVTNWLRQQGFDAAQSIAGGIDAWSSRVDPKVPRY